ncbi:MAG TPA: tRNA (N(6)-L-threonylcarbamoyladenosine(37)-C(2))-methylthiotransferase MtaB [Alphaproteobacteria bacterium]
MSIKMKQEPQVVTFGCRLNTYESEVMRGHARAAGLEDAIIFNTCAVTKEAERQARQAIRKARRENPGARIIVTGCSAQIDPQAYAQMPEVDQVIGNDLKLKEETWGLPATEKILVNDIMSVKETAGHLIEGVDGHARAFIQVQNGCDHRCTFCIIPYGRGNSRSVPMGAIADQVRKLVGAGYNEVVFSGVDITSYGADLPGQPKLGQMIKRVLAAVPELPRLRLSSLDPVEMDDDLWRLIAEEPRLMPHLHVSLQAGDDMILKRMKRRHLRADAIEMCSRARSYRPDMVFGADLIAGFPTETDEMFDNSLNIIEECGLTFLHIFPYSPRPGTPAAKMPQVDKQVRKVRAARLRTEGEKQVIKFLNSNLNKQRQIIVEQDNIGRTEHFAAVKIDRALPVGSLARVMITGIEGDKLAGQVVAI